MLSRKLTQVVADHRKKHKPLASTTTSQIAVNQYFENDDLKSEKSTKSKCLSGTLQFNSKIAPTAPVAPQEDISKIIMAMTVNKGVGMSDAEWNEIVKNSVEEEQKQKELAKLKLIK